MTIEDAMLQRWGMIDKRIPYVAANGIPTFWRAHPELGSPLGRELPFDEGVAQAFTGGVVVWDPTGGARMLTE